MSQPLKSNTEYKNEVIPMCIKETLFSERQVKDAIFNDVVAIQR